MRRKRGIQRSWLMGLIGLWMAPSTVIWANDYTSGFYTRGIETALYLDTGDPVFDPYYLPLRRVSLVPRATLAGTRTDNLLLSADEDVVNTTVDLAPGVMLIWGRPEGRHLYLDYGTRIRLYDSGDDLDPEPDHLLMAGAVYRTARSQAQIEAGYRRTETADMMVDARLVKRDYVLNTALDYRLSAKTAAGLVGSVERHDFQSDRYIDYDRYYGAGRLYYDMTQRSQAFVQGGLGHDDIDSGPGGYGDADFADISMGMRGKPSPKSSMSGRVGYQWRSYDDDRITAVEHWIAGLGGSVSPLGFTTYRADLHADIRPDITEAGGATIGQRLTLGASRRLFTERLRGQMSVFAGRVDYRGPAAEEDTPRRPGGTRDSWGYTLGLDWWTKHLSYGLGYSYAANRGVPEARSDTHRAAYDVGTWTLRVSWNY